MDRDTLSYLLKSGKYLCFNPLDADDSGTRRIVINLFLARKSSPTKQRATLMRLN